MTSPATSSRSSRLFRTSLWLHRWSSLLATPFFVVLCLTGTVLIFHTEIDAGLGYAPRSVSPLGIPGPGSLDRWAEVAALAKPHRRILDVYIDDERYPGLVGFAMAPEGDRGFDQADLVWIDTATGKARIAPDPDATPTGFILKLHGQWLLGAAGELIGALIALLVLVSLLSAVVVYAPYVRRVAFGAIRRGQGGRLGQLDWHNFIGVVVLGWVLVVSATGFALGFGSVALFVWQATELSAISKRLEGGSPVDPLAPPAGPSAAWETARLAAAGWKPSALFYPGTDFSPATQYSALLRGESGVERRLYKLAIVDARTGDLIEVDDLPWYARILFLSQPLHFGDFGGLPLKLIWVASSLLTLFITGNGSWLWWERRRRSNPSGAADHPATIR